MNKWRTLRYRGEEHTVTEWGGILGLNPSTIYFRLKLYGSSARAIDKVLSKERYVQARKIRFGGEEHTIAEWSRIIGVPGSTLRSRLDAFGYSGRGLATALTHGHMRYLRNAKLVTYGGMTKSLKEWAEYVGLKPKTFRARLRKGYTFEEALRKDPKYTQADKGRLFGGHRVMIDGVTANIAEHCRRRGISYNTVQMRIRNGANCVSAITDRVLTAKETQERAITARWDRRRRNQAAALGIVL